VGPSRQAKEMALSRLRMGDEVATTHTADPHRHTECREPNNKCIKCRSQRISVSHAENILFMPLKFPDFEHYSGRMKLVQGHTVDHSS